MGATVRPERRATGGLSMGVRSVRFHDLPAVHRVESSHGSQVLWPAGPDAPHSLVHLAVASAWQDVNQTVFTFVLREKRELLGLIQATARPGRDAWDLVRLAVTPTDPEDRQRVAELLLEEMLRAAGGRGGLRTFARAPSRGEACAILTRQGFRHYTTEYTLVRDGLDMTPAPLPEHLEFRPRRPADAWGIFQLYCAVAPPLVRHAEGLSSKRWGQGASLAHAVLAPLLHPPEVVLADEGMIVGWVRLCEAPGRGHGMQRLDVMLHPRAYPYLPALLVHAAVVLAARLDRRTVCYVRTYEQTVFSSLTEAGFAVTAEHALFVKHAVARVSERQLLIAALRAQSLGLDVSRSRQTHQPDPSPALVPSHPSPRPAATLSTPLPVLPSSFLEHSLHVTTDH